MVVLTCLTIVPDPSVLAADTRAVVGVTQGILAHHTAPLLAVGAVPVIRALYTGRQGVTEIIDYSK